MSDFRGYGRSQRLYAPKPANFDALANAWNDPDTFDMEAAKYADQCSRAGIYPGHLTGIVNNDGTIS